MPMTKLKRKALQVSLSVALVVVALSQALFAASPTVETLAPGLETPWAIDLAADGRAFVTERTGRIRAIENGKLRIEPWITIDVAAVGEAGLLGLAVDPQFAQNRFVYAAYTYRTGVFQLRNRLVHLREDLRTGKGIIGKILIDDFPGANNHDGGRVKLGPDGKLYWAVGDAQTTRYAQNLKSLNGKILRLNPDGIIPKDNPFANSYVYSYGHRNPQSLAWQPGTVRLFATEHGPSGFRGCCRDEVNLIESGKNYGWLEVRGDESKEGMVSPLLNAGTSETWTPGGAAFPTQGPWAGSLLFTGLRGLTLYRAIIDSANPSIVERLEWHFAHQFDRLRDIVEGPDKALYLLTSNREGPGSPGPQDDRV
jgi:glucose/arabinose dehydrogenase